MRSGPDKLAISSVSAAIHDAQPCVDDKKGRAAYDCPDECKYPIVGAYPFAEQVFVQALILWPSIANEPSATNANEASADLASRLDRLNMNFIFANCR